MTTLKILGIINLAVIAITFLAIFGGASNEAVGLWALIMMGLAIAQSIIGIVNNK